MGLRMWLLQRLTAVCMAFYATCAYFYFSGQPLTYSLFRSFFETMPLALLGCLTVLAMTIHAWIGIWTVATDYLKCSCVRHIFLSLYGLLLVLTVLDALLFVVRI